MARDPYVHAKEDLGNIREWLAGRGRARTVPFSPPAPITVPPPADARPEPAEEWTAPELQTRTPVQDCNTEPVEVPKPAEPERNDACQHCGKPLPTLRSRDKQYCDRYCSKAARKARCVSVSG
jgi:hypothetical protein